jgi:8-oxo-dGTP pyrophosphatase MutT (NUDIX family)
MATLTENVKLLQKAVLIHNGEFLILRRGQDEYSRPNCWDLPGGNAEWPTDQKENVENVHQEDVSREIKEETGIYVLSQHFTKENLSLFRTFFEAEAQIYTVITGWKVEMPSDFDRSQVEISDEHIDYKWIRFQDLSDYDFGGKKGEFIKDMIRGAL